MPDIVTTQTFVDGEKGITATKMNNIIANSVIQTDFIANKPSSSTLDPTDQLIELKGAGTYARITGQQLINSVSASVNQNFFVSKTAAYTLTSADSGKYVICTGGSWTLTLPAPTVGFNYRVRNDMGISGTIGTITLQPTTGTIDGLASIPLLPQQECMLITDGANWRTYAKQRCVVLGTQDITTSTASNTILLPTGYRVFEIDLTGIVLVTSGQILQFQLSVDGGTTWIADGTYREASFYDNAATTVAYTSGSVTSPSLSNTFTNLTAAPGQSHLTLYPGATGVAPSWLLHSGGFGTSRISQVVTQGYRGVNGVVNALKYFASSGNITNSFLTIKGLV